ncbi:uncharacterized protein LOC131014920 [Salvia miltiorrhiza]|uniref:uncharacterized protein LOC131014920 n=1 Tax=Salvia miltiorrhiza TaxID=226208 RepID=UPI0025ACC536|nr:uncharacterized protein LOC131014920 [Salvia miltiorrhiza]
MRSHPSVANTLGEYVNVCCWMFHLKPLIYFELTILSPLAAFTKIGLIGYVEQLSFLTVVSLIKLNVLPESINILILCPLTSPITLIVVGPPSPRIALRATATSSMVFASNSPSTSSASACINSSSSSSVIIRSLNLVTSAIARGSIALNTNCYDLS